MPSRDSPVDLLLKSEDIRKAAEIRKSFVKTLEHNPIYDSARATLDRAEAMCPSTDDNKDAPPPSVIIGARNAMQQLKDNLNTIRSRSNTYFKESVPVTQNESCIRALISSDFVNESVEQAVRDPPTSITINMRPHNLESFKSARQSFLKDSAVPIVSPKDEDDVATFMLRSNLRVDMTASPNAQETVERVEKLLGQFVPMFAQELRVQLEVKFVDDENDRNFKNIMITVAKYGNKDPLEKLVQSISKKILKKASSNCSSFEAETAAPDVLRLATARVEIPHDLNEWIINKDNQSLTTLFEGARIAFEAIVRDDSKSYLSNDLAQEALADFDSGDVSRLLGSLVGLGLFREAGVHINTAPFELLFARAVKDISRQWRATLKQELESDSDEAERGNAFLGSSIPEESVAAILSVYVVIFGVTPNVFKDRLLPLFAYQMAASSTEEVPNMIIGAGLAFKEIFAGIGNIEILAPSAEIKIETKGIDAKFLIVIPGTLQELVDYAKPYGIAGSDSDDVDQLDDEDKVEEIIKEFDEKKESGTKKEMPRISRHANDGMWYGEKMEQCHKEWFGKNDVFGFEREVRRAPLGAAMFQKPVKLGDTDEKSSWCFDDLPVELTKCDTSSSEANNNKEDSAHSSAASEANDNNNNNNNAKADEATPQEDNDDDNVSRGAMSSAAASSNASSCASNDDDDDKSGGGDDDSKEEDNTNTTVAVAVVAPTTSGVNMVTCDDCGVEYNAALPTGHTCLRSSPPRRRGGNNSSTMISPSRNVGKNSKNRLFERLGQSFVIPTDDESLKEIFNTFDQNGDGKIDRKEFVQEYAEFESSFGVPITDSDIQRKFRRADRNNDGSLSFKEFCYFMVSRAAQ